MHDVVKRVARYVVHYELGHYEPSRQLLVNDMGVKRREEYVIQLLTDRVRQGFAPPILPPTTALVVERVIQMYLLQLADLDMPLWSLTYVVTPPRLVLEVLVGLALCQINVTLFHASFSLMPEWS